MDNLLPASAFGLGLGYLALIYRMPVGDVEDPVGPRMFPTIIAAGIILCSLFLWRESRAVVQDTLQQKPEDPVLRRRQIIGILCVSAGTFAYVVALEPLGYLLSSFLFMLALLAAFHRERPIVNVIVAACVSAVLYVGLKDFLGVALPNGVLDAILS